MTLTREAVLQAAREPSTDVFVQLMNQNKSRSTDVVELLGTFTKKQLEQLWTELQCKCGTVLLGLRSEQGDTQQEQDLSTASQFLTHVVSVAMTTISLQPVFVPEALFETAVLLHGILLSLPVSLDRLCQSISRLCESWWTKDLAGRQELSTHTLLFLLQTSVDVKGTMADVKRVYHVRDSLKLLNFGASSSDTLKMLLKKALISAVYLKCDEGRTFLSYVFNLNVDLIDILHKTIKNQLPGCPNSMLEWYGQIYFKAWRIASGPILSKLESDCIQDLMFHAVHAGRGSSRSLAASLRKVLTCFHKQKKQRGVDELLQRLYEPILWRSLKVANGNVRANAAALFMDAFPLIDPELNVREIDERMQQQFDIIERLLFDPVVAVRCTMIHGVCRICNVFWELIPIASIQSFLTTLVHQLSCDAASADVRIAVIKGISSVLSNHLSHPLLKTLLPEMRNLLHDTSEKVRVAFMDLLQKIKGMRFFKFWNIAPVEHLLARLEVDEAPVARRIVNLVFSSYLPLDKGPEEQISRCVALVQANREAARRFYQYAHKHMTLAQTCDFMSLVCRCLLVCVRREAQQNGSNISDNELSSVEDLIEPLDQPEKENETGDEGADELTMRDVSLMAGLLDTIVILWCAISAQLQQPSNEPLKKRLQKRFSFALPELFRAFDDAEIISALIMLAGFLPSARVPTFSRSMLSKLRAMPAESSSDEYGTMLESMCKWGKTNDVLELIDSWLSSVLQVTTVESPFNNKTGKVVGFNVPHAAPCPALAIRYLNYLMRHHVCREVLLQKSRDQLHQLSDNLSHILSYLERRFVSAEEASDDVDDSLLAEAFETYCKLQVILHNPEVSDMNVVAAIEEILLWAEQEPLRLLRGRQRKKQQRRLLNRTEATLLGPDMNLTSADMTLAAADMTLLSQTFIQRQNFTDVQLAAVMALATDLVTRLLSVCTNMLLVGVGDHQLAAHISRFAIQLIQLDSGSGFLPATCHLMYQICEFTLSSENMPQIEDEGIGLQEDIIPGMLGKVLETLAALVHNKREQAVKILPSLRPVFGEVLHSYYKFHSLQNTASKDVMASIMASSVAEVTNDIKKSGEFLQKNSVSDLPPLSSFLLSLLTRRASLLSLFLDELCECVNSGAVSELEGHLAALQLVHAICTGNCRLSEVKTCLEPIAEKLQAEDLADVLEDSPIRQMHTAGLNLLKECMTRVGMVI